MSRSFWSSTLLALAVAACGTTAPGTRPHDMSAAQHQREADSHAAMAEQHQAEYAPAATARKENCRSRIGRTGRQFSFLAVAAGAYSARKENCRKKRELPLPDRAHRERQFSF